ncbi:MAG: hypothetical protein MJ252_11360, partial [archaeon]|nr:hypothetical protein [archaeon]
PEEDKKEEASPSPNAEEEKIVGLIKDSIKNVMGEENQDKIGIQMKDTYNYEFEDEHQKISVKVKLEGDKLLVGTEPFESWLKRMFKN